MYTERGRLLAPYLLPGAGGANTCTPLASRIVRDVPIASDRLRIPGSALDSNCTDGLDLTAGFSYHVVSFRLHTCSTCLPRRTAIPLFMNHNVSACQSTRGHQERTPNPCQQSLYNRTTCQNTRFNQSKQKQKFIWRLASIQTTDRNWKQKLNTYLKIMRDSKKS